MGRGYRMPPAPPKDREAVSAAAETASLRSIYALRHSCDERYHFSHHICQADLRACAAVLRQVVGIVVDGPAIHLAGEIAPVVVDRVYLLELRSCIDHKAELEVLNRASLAGNRRR